MEQSRAGPAARMKLGDYQIDNLKLTTLGWWSAMHDEQILRRARGRTDVSVSGREKQEDFSELQGRCWAEAAKAWEGGDTIAKVNSSVVYEYKSILGIGACYVEMCS